ncbi:MAG: ABC transporter ATP-binding protein [Treponema sp.]|nr:ABC transporter ATP-binding protein [Treponema sp.]
MAKLYVSNICAGYGDKLVLKNVSVAVESGKLTCLCGPNGCGKSTLISVLAGAVEPGLKILGGVNKSADSADSDQIDALELAKLPRIKAAQLVSYMQQSEFSTWNFTVKELVLQGRFCHSKNGSYTAGDEKIALQAMEEMGIADLADRPVHSLSGGEFQKTRIARAICQSPRFILLDEPSANLDFVYEPLLLKKLASLAHSTDTGILVSIHDINAARTCADDLILLPLLQKPICGTMEQTLTLENLEKTYGMEFKCQKVNCFQSSL